MTGTPRRFAPAARLAVLPLLFLAMSASAQGTGAIRGQAVNSFGDPATDAEIRVATLSRVVGVDREGRFMLEAVPAGVYPLEVTSPEWGRGVATVAVEAGETTELTIELSLVFHGQEIVVSTGARPQSELYRPADVLQGPRLRAEAENSLGETLARRPGVNSTYFGPGASRPVIRGLQGDRVRMLERGVGTGDASSTSPDHAVAADATSANRIEILRGPATLLYGSSAIGGVVNVIDERIPTERHPHLATGRLVLRGSSVSDEANGAGELNLGVGPLAVHAGGMYRRTENYRIPGAVVDESLLPGHDAEAGGAAAEAPVDGRLPNSNLESWRTAVGASYVGDNGYIGASYISFNSEYGLPGGQVEEGQGDPEAARIDLRQHRVDADGSWRVGSRFLKGINGRFGYSDYRHFEKVDGDIETTFNNDQWEARGEVQHHFGGRVEGTFGVQFGGRDFAALGEEAFISRTRSSGLGLFVVEEFGAGPLRLGAGLRYDHRPISNAAADVERKDSGVSASLGANWFATESLVLGVTGSRSVKFPSAEELFSDGPHLATRSFEVGDPTLENETGYSLDASLRLVEGIVTGSFSLFGNWFDRYIFLRFTGDEVEGLPVVTYRQGDAMFVGVEGELQFELFHLDAHHVVLDAQGDWVRAELTGTDEPLPLIPPLRLGGALRYEGNRFDARLGVRWIDDQNRVSGLETPTPGYTMLDASVGFRFFTRSLVHRIELRGTNLTNAEGRVHTSLVKAFAPLPGTDIRLVYQLLF